MAELWPQSRNRAEKSQPLSVVPCYVAILSPAVLLGEWEHALPSASEVPRKVDQPALCSPAMPWESQGQNENRKIRENEKRDLSKSAPQEAPWACEQQSQGRAERWQQLLHLHCCFLCSHILAEMLIQRTEVFLRTLVPALRIRSAPGGLLHDLLWEVSIYVNQGL